MNIKIFLDVKNPRKIISFFIHIFTFSYSFLEHLYVHYIIHKQAIIFGIFLVNLKLLFFILFLLINLLFYIFFSLLITVVINLSIHHNLLCDLEWTCWRFSHFIVRTRTYFWTSCTWKSISSFKLGIWSNWLLRWVKIMNC